MSKQPEALSLAAEVGMYGTPCAKKAAAELRRLHAVNAELVEALRGLEGMAERYREPGAPIPDAQKKARAAIAKATGEQQ